VLTTGTYLACRRLGLTPVLWTAWGEDWRARATPRSVLHTVTRDLRGGGTVLLHDSDCTSATGSWRNTLAAVPRLIDTIRDRGLTVGPLRDHAEPAAAGWRGGHSPGGFYPK
jgi:peptidoglycan/xylan/chitin deacetylase (PgdA/CDA1 family)